MLNLIKLELRRMNIKSVALSFLLINTAIVSMMMLISIEPEAVTEFLTSIDDVQMLIELLVIAAFVIYAAVLMSHIIIEEFKNKTITLLFMYPVSRRKLLMAKLIIISLFTFFFIIASVLIVYYSFSVFNRFYMFTPLELGYTLSSDYMLHLVLLAVACVGLSLIPLFFGMRKYSVPATITSSIFIVALLSSSVNTDDTNLFSITAIPILLGVIGFITANLVVNQAVKKDF
ncbi:ABC transporter permease [Jeotgalibacillus terrae]|uniref:ABC transporter permease n=1 Tax=Jeotgalibacillus terrae TaxID=587735 RepID=A0ABW5ZJC3_9BACL|nr:ABC transporter permease [Jeotgalibacillus terrae]MBM7578559.1 ABC-type transport system involved in multi-copper enzyme maturation permease subunit [Jeotgalibacillus terrae]